MEVYEERYYSLGRLQPQSLFLIKKRLAQFQKDYDIKDYPLDCFALLKKIQEAGKIDLMVEFSDRLPFGLEAATCWLPEIKGYYIVTKNVPKDWKRRSSWRRCNFTIAHELGHIFLGHLEIHTEMKSPETRRKEDDEADEFAGRLLMPEKMILKSNCSSKAELAREYLVSESACFIRLNNLKRLDLFGAPDKKICPVCGNSRISQIAECCEICGAHLASVGCRGVRAIDYPLTMTDCQNHVLFCPRCGNEEYSDNAKFCRICGLPAYNMCGSNDLYLDCNHVNAANARYCELCGHPTVYAKQKLFADWKNERDECIRSLTQA